MKRILIIASVLLASFSTNYCSQVKEKSSIISEAEQWLLEAAVSGDMNKLELALAQEVSVNKTDSMGFTALILAAKYQRQNIVERLLKHPRIDVDATNNNRETALIWAGIKGDHAIIQQLLKAGATESLTDKHGRSYTYWVNRNTPSTPQKSSKDSIIERKVNAETNTTEESRKSFPFQESKEDTELQVLAESNPQVKALLIKYKPEQITGVLKLAKLFPIGLTNIIMEYMRDLSENPKEIACIESINIDSLHFIDENNLFVKARGASALLNVEHPETSLKILRKDDLNYMGNSLFIGRTKDDATQLEVFHMDEPQPLKVFSSANKRWLKFFDCYKQKLLMQHGSELVVYDMKLNKVVAIVKPEVFSSLGKFINENLFIAGNNACIQLWDISQKAVLKDFKTNAEKNDTLKNLLVLDKGFFITFIERGYGNFSSEPNIKVWHIDQDVPIASFEDYAIQYVAPIDNKYLLCSNVYGQVIVLDIHQQQIIKKFVLDKKVRTSEKFQGLAFGKNKFVFATRRQGMRTYLIPIYLWVYNELSECEKVYSNLFNKASQAALKNAENEVAKEENSKKITEVIVLRSIDEERKDNTKK